MTDPLHLAAAVEATATTSAEHRSFEDFFQRERAGLYGALCLVTRNRHEAEELTQDALVRLLERWDRVSEMNDPHAYLHRTAMNAFRSRYRRTLVATKRTLVISRPDDEIADVDERDVAVRALAHLSPRQRASVVLTDLLGYSSEEAARMLGIRASTVRMHASRTHTVLKDAMNDE